jgi:hypothetical protein
VGRLAELVSYLVVRPSGLAWFFAGFQRLDNATRQALNVAKEELLRREKYTKEKRRPKK